MSRNSVALPDTASTPQFDLDGQPPRRSVRFVLQNPYLQALLFSAVALCVIILGSIGLKRIADAMSPQPPSIPPPVDLWLEYRLVTAEGEVVADGARLEVDAVIRLERFVGVERSIGETRLSLTGSGDFRARAPVVPLAGPELRDFRTPVAWTSRDIREGRSVLLRDAGEFSAMVEVPNRPVGPQRRLRFTVGDGAPARPTPAAGRAADRIDHTPATAPPTPDMP